MNSLAKEAFSNIGQTLSHIQLQSAFDASEYGETHDSSSTEPL